MLRGIEKTLAAMGDQHMHHYVLRHFMHQGGIDEAHQRHMPGQVRIAQKAIHPRAQGKDRLQIGEGLHEARRRPEAREIMNSCRIIRIAVGDQSVEAMGGKAFRRDRRPARRQHAFEKDFGICHRSLCFIGAPDVRG